MLKRVRVPVLAAIVLGLSEPPFASVPTAPTATFVSHLGRSSVAA
jgi:hypothetical protein